MGKRGYKVSVNNLSRAVREILDEYADGVSEKELEISATIAAECSLDLQSAGAFKGTDYRKSWKFKPDTVGRHLVSFTVYNDKHYQLTHLLEDGHEIWTHGKPTGARTAPYPHIKPIEDKYVKEFEKRIKEAAQE